MTGTSIGLVLGGGGARGNVVCIRFLCVTVYHLGVVRFCVFVGGRSSAYWRDTGVGGRGNPH